MSIIFGVGLIIWGFTAGIGTRENNRAGLFSGPVGTIVSLVVIGLGFYLAISNFF